MFLDAWRAAAGQFGRFGCQASRWQGTRGAARGDTAPAPRRASHGRLSPHRRPARRAGPRAVRAGGAVLRGAARGRRSCARGALLPLQARDRQGRRGARAWAQGGRRRLWHGRAHARDGRRVRRRARMVRHLQSYFARSPSLSGGVRRMRAPRMPSGRWKAPLGVKVPRRVPSCAGSRGWRCACARGAPVWKNCVHTAKPGALERRQRGKLRTPAWRPRREGQMRAACMVGGVRFAAVHAKSTDACPLPRFRGRPRPSSLAPCATLNPSARRTHPCVLC